ncbi:hypothetical protein ACFSQ7_01595 [Paenibacillus rhizoplanae]
MGDYRAFHTENIHAIQDKALEKGYFTQETKTYLTNAAIGYYHNMSNQDYLKELVRDGSLAAMTLVLIFERQRVPDHHDVRL